MMTRSDRAWLIALLQEYDEIEIGIKAGTHYTRDYQRVEKHLKVYLKKELFDNE